LEKVTCFHSDQKYYIQLFIQRYSPAILHGLVTPIIIILTFTTNHVTSASIAIGK